MHECDYCEKEYESKNMLKNHKLVAHSDEISSEEGTIDVSDGHLEEREVEKGEQFGYRK